MDKMMEEKKFIISESLLRDIVNYISHSRSELKSGQVVNMIDAIRNLKTVEETENAKKQEDPKAQG